MNPRHMKIDGTWITPGAGQKIDYVHRSKLALGGEIDLDPYSSDIANTVVGALRYYTEKDDGHAQPWDADRVFVNHPGGHTVRAWNKLCEEYRSGRAKWLIWIGFSVEQLNLLANPVLKDGMPVPAKARWADARYYPLDFSVLFTRNRIDFLKEAYWCTSCDTLPSDKTGLCECGAYAPPPAPTLKKGGRPSHGNYVVGIGMYHTAFELAFGDLGYIHKGPLSVE